jgi:hypothetical protein
LRKRLESTLKTKDSTLPEIQITDPDLFDHINSPSEFEEQENIRKTINNESALQFKGKSFNKLSEVELKFITYSKEELLDLLKVYEKLNIEIFKNVNELFKL